MTTLEEYKKELARLKSIQEVQKDFARRNRETKKVKAQIFALKHQKGLNVAKTIGRGALFAGSNLGKSLRKLGENFAENTRQKPRRRK